MNLEVDSVGLLLFGFLLFLRCYALIVVIPVARAFLGVAGITALSVALSLALLASDATILGNYSALVEKGLLSFALISLRELFIGLLIGAPLAISLESLVMAGRIADVSRGAQFGEQLVPALGSGLSPGQRIAMFGVALMVVSPQGYQLGFAILKHSVEVVNPMSIMKFSSSSGLGTLAGVNVFIAISTHAITEGVLLASPVLLASFLLDLGASILSRALGRVNVVFELMPLKMLFGFGLLSYLFTEGYVRVNELIRVVAQEVSSLLIG